MTRAPQRQNITIREVRKGKVSGVRHHKKGVSAEKALIGVAIGGLVLGFIDKSATTIPTIPILGKAGTIALAAHFLGKGKPGMVTDIRNAAAAVAGYEMGKDGKISGDEDGFRPSPPRMV